MGGAERGWEPAAAAVTGGPLLMGPENSWRWWQERPWDIVKGPQGPPGKDARRDSVGRKDREMEVREGRSEGGENR